MRNWQFVPFHVGFYKHSFFPGWLNQAAWLAPGSCAGCRCLLSDSSSGNCHLKVLRLLILSLWKSYCRNRAHPRLVAELYVGSGGL